MLANILIGLMSQKLIPKRLRKAAFVFGGNHELQRKGLVLDVGFMLPLLVWRGYCHHLGRHCEAIFLPIAKPIYELVQQ